MYPYFTTQQIFPLYPALLLLLLSVLAFVRNRNKLSLCLLFLGALILGYFIASLDPFLILWDEQYHALVAKNMMEHPFKPMLYANPVLGYDYRDWPNNYVWLHKPPLFLWQIALSLKLFGVNTLSVRIPSIVMHAVIPLFIYRIGSIALDKKTGFYGALFFAVAYFPLELVAARYSTDHNDIAFLFYITASVWTWFEYEKSGKTHWIVLTGLFSGCAILVKWLVGLLVYAPWGISLLADRNKRSSYISYSHLLISFLITLLTFLPWHLYIIHNFPKEAYYEMEMNTRHLFTAIEGHSGSFWYHFIALRKLYGQGQAVPFLLLTGMIILYFRTSRLTYKIGLLLPPLLIYLFYSLAATKMLSFCIIAAPYVFLGMSSFMLSFTGLIGKWINKPALLPYITVAFAITIAFFNLDLRQIQGYHTMWKPHDNWNRKAELFEMKGIQAIKNACNNNRYIIFNANMRVNGHIPVMFYTNQIAYPFIPSVEQLNMIHKNEYKIAMISSPDLPDYIKSDTTIRLITINN